MSVLAAHSMSSLVYSNRTLRVFKASKDKADKYKKGHIKKSKTKPLLTTKAKYVSASIS